MSIRYRWQQTSKGNWICWSGMWTGVLQRRAQDWELRVKTPTGISRTTHAGTEAEAKVALEQMLLSTAVQGRGVHLLDFASGPHGEWWLR